MNRHLAGEFATKYREFGAWFNEMTELTLRVDDPETAKSIRRKLGEMTIALDDAVYRPMKNQFPDLFDDC